MTQQDVQIALMAEKISQLEKQCEGYGTLLDAIQAQENKRLRTGVIALGGVTLTILGAFTALVTLIFRKETGF